MRVVLDVALVPEKDLGLGSRVNRSGIQDPRTKGRILVVEILFRWSPERKKQWEFLEWSCSAFGCSAGGCSILDAERHAKDGKAAPACRYMHRLATSLSFDNIILILT